ncbi:MAG: hypothetical protein IKN42_01185, partial [Elusimicrobia bacterium]|nr:hypothetical protein [Elusimicrobiota bacterium]
ILNSSSKDLQVLQLLSYLNKANLYNDVEAQSSNKGFFRRNRDSNTASSGLVNLLSFIEDEKAESDSFQSSSRDLENLQQKRNSNLYNGISAQRDIAKNRYMNKDNWLSKVLKGKTSLSREDLIKLGKLYQKRQGDNQKLSDNKYVELGKQYLEQIRLKNIESINEEYSLVQESIQKDKDAINDMYSNKILSRFRSMVSSQKAAIARLSMKYTNNIPKRDQQIRKELSAIFKEAGIEDVTVDTKIYKEKNSVSKVLARICDLFINKGLVIATTVVVSSVAFMLTSSFVAIAPMALLGVAVVGMGIILFNMYLRKSKVDRYEAYRQQKGGFEDISAEFVNTGNFKLIGNVAEGALYKLSATMGKIGIYAPAFAFIAGVAMLITGVGSIPVIAGIFAAGLLMSALSLITSLVVIKVNTNRKDGLNIDAKAVSDMKDVPTKTADNVLSGLVVAGISTLITAAIALFMGQAIVISAATIGIFAAVSAVVYGLYYLFNNVLPAKNSRRAMIDQKSQGVLKSLAPSFVGFALSVGVIASMAFAAVSVGMFGTAIAGIMFVFTSYGAILKIRDEIRNANGDRTLIRKAPGMVLRSLFAENPMVLFSALGLIVGGLFAGNLVIVLPLAILSVIAIALASRTDNPRLEKAVLVIVTVLFSSFGVTSVASAGSGDHMGYQQQTQNVSEETETEAETEAAQTEATVQTGITEQVEASVTIADLQSQDGISATSEISPFATGINFYPFLSYLAKKGTANYGFSQLYDNSLAGIMCLVNGDTEQAKNLLSAIAANELKKSSVESNYIGTGEALWAGIFAMYCKNSGIDVDMSGSSATDIIISNVDNYLSFYNIDGDFRGFTGTHNEDWISTEHMLDAAMYYALKGDTVNLNKVLLFIKENLIDEQGRFKQGLGDDKQAIDTYTWGYMMLSSIKNMNIEGVDIDSIFGENFLDN